MKRTSLNPTGEMARWLRQNQDNQEAARILKIYEKAFRLSDEEYKEASRLRERLELLGRGLFKAVKPGLYYKESTNIIYKVNKGSATAEWREVTRNWWSKDADMVLLTADIKNGTTLPLTSKLASEIGLKNGICCMCGKSLTEEGSLKTGIGPVCARNLKKSEEENDN
ncbi:hypothetical protein UFOVP658_81 [uncultured Caudovirales phage]|uniref:Uncharacterized protein n=1 Tax=uncultured Caudovirales phage TaxID=2100421 RepID=A0A6J5NBX4_9CAUD|nr:hypothetical protein UFOVP658_81 [uncultured Caudovirales phage]